MLLGFLLSYYLLFGRHVKSDKKAKRMKEIHKDLDDILRKANESGFMSQNFVEAVLPDIFQEGEEPNSGPNATNSEPVTKSKDTAADETHRGRSEESRKTTQTDSLSQKTGWKGKPHDKSTKVQKKKKTKKKRKKRKRKRTGDEPEAPQVRADAVPKGSGLKSNASNIDSSSSGANSSSPIQEATASSVESETPNVAEAVNEGKKQPDSPIDTDGEPGSRETNNSVSSELNVTSSGNAEALKPSVTGALPVEGNVGSPATEQTRTQEATTHAHRKISSAQKVLPPQFEGLVNMQVSEGSIPILNWHYEAIMNESTTEQIFGLGDRHDHIVVYKPLCLNTESEKGILFEGKTVCGGFNRTEEWMKKYCNVMKAATRKECLLKVQSERESKEWLERNAESIHWVPGLTVLQVLERNCGNIAHFAGRALLLQHIIENIGSYVAPPSDLSNILILPAFHTMKRFLYPQNYAYWHERFLGAVVAPEKLGIGDLGNFLYRASKRRQPNEPLVQLLHNFSIAQSTFAEKKYVCFKRVVIPGYLKGRFFVNDVDYPSSQPSLQSEDNDGPSIPRDSLRMRERMSVVVDQTSELRNLEKGVIFIDRQGKRRIFDEAKKEGIVKAFQDVASEHNYKFKVISFENMTFDEQYKAVSSAAIAIGIHGANLVNTMFMPPLAALIELFPYGFVHEMYRNGGNAGLKYFSYQMSTGIPFKGKRVYRSPEQCVRLNKNCKVHYRDSIMQVTDNDIANMAKILAEAIAWCDKRPHSPKPVTEPAKRRRLLRRLIDKAMRRGHRRSLT